MKNLFFKTSYFIIEEYDRGQPIYRPRKRKWYSMVSEMVFDKYNNYGSFRNINDAYEAIEHDKNLHDSYYYKVHKV